MAGSVSVNQINAETVLMRASSGRATGPGDRRYGFADGVAALHVHRAVPSMDWCCMIQRRTGRAQFDRGAQNIFCISSWGRAENGLCPKRC
jgi:hypothetical protein